MACLECTSQSDCQKPECTCAEIDVAPGTITVAKVKLTVSIDGMTCASCPAAITRALNQLSHIDGLYISLLDKSATMLVPREKVDEVLETISDTGYDTQVVSIQETQVESADTGLRKIQLRIDGMFCGACPIRLKDSLGRHEWIHKVDFDGYQNCLLSVTYRPRPPHETIRQIFGTIEDLGFVAHVFEQPLASTIATQKAQLEIKHYLFSILLTLAAAIPTFIIGICFMDLLPAHNPARHYFEQSIHGRLSRGVLVMLICATPIEFGVACIFHKPAIRSIIGLWKRKSSATLTTRLVRFGNMNLLISLGVTIAYFSSLALVITSVRQEYDGTTEETTYFDSVVFLCLFILIGRFLEASSKKKMKNAIALLSNMKPRQASLIGSSGVSTVVDSALLEVGDRCNIPKGSSPPVDGVIVDVATFFDESSLTGESRPAKRIPGDKVYSGTVNTGKQVIIEVTSTNGHNVLDSIVQVISEGSAHRAPIELFGDVLTAYFVPAICAASVVVFIVWLGLSYAHVVPASSNSAIFSIQFSISVFVIACPCGIGLAAPTASAVGSGMCAKLGILASGGSEAFSDASQIVAVVFDKTGTLTSGRMQVTGVERLEPHAETNTEGFLTHAMLLLEQTCTHPIAQVIVSWCQPRVPTGIEHNIQVLQSQELPGMGIRGQLKPAQGPVHDVIIGNETMMCKYGLARPLQGDAGTATTVFVACKFQDDAQFQYSLKLTFSDPLRDEAHTVVKDLMRRKISCYLLTGDNPLAAHSVAQEIGIPSDHVMCNVSPTDKHEYLIKLNSHYASSGKVCFVGDGINDAAALASAGVSVSLSSASDIAISSASFILINSNLLSLLTLLDLSKIIYRRIKFNFGWAIIFNLIAIPIAAGVFYPLNNFVLSPAWASLAMALSSISVVMSSFALLLQKPVRR